jgi:nucleoside-triphosphatase THEP1
MAYAVRNGGLRGSRLELHIAIIEVGPVEMKAETILAELEEALHSMRIQNTMQHIQTVRPGLSEKPVQA